MVNGKSLSLSTLASMVGNLVVILPVLWFVAKPLVFEMISAEVKDDIEREVKVQLAPAKTEVIEELALLRKDLRVLLWVQVAEVEDMISAAEYAQSSAPTEFSRSELSELKLLRRRLDALKELQE